MKMKKIVILSALIFSTGMLFAQSTTTANSKARIKFLKGNITEKTAAVREASGNDAVWLSNKAIEFCLENKEIIGNDRELDALAVAAILSISPDYVQNMDDLQKRSLSLNFLSLFANFNSSSTVQIAVITKIIACKNQLPSKDFSDMLNNYLKTSGTKTADSSVFKAALVALEAIGNNETFSILYGFYNSDKYNGYKTEIEKTMISLVPDAMNEVLDIIHSSDLDKLSKFYALISKNSKISKNNLCEISENVISQTILIMENSSRNVAGGYELQLSALKTLAENKWTRSSSIVLSLFQTAKKNYENALMTESQFTEVICSLSSIAPIDAVSPLITYLEELNAVTEKGNKVSDQIVMAVINTLGAIGDKSAFDSLLAVTYLNYSEAVLSAAREALSGLRWQ